MQTASHQSNLFEEPFLSVLPALESGKTRLLTLPWKDRKSMPILAVRITIEDTPFSLIALLPAAEVFGYLALKQWPLALGLLALLVLWGAFAIIRTNTQNLILKARYDEAAKQQTKLETRNARLRGEIIKRQEGEARLNYMAHHDALTGLPNRVLFNDRLQHALQRAEREQHQLAVLFFDLDRFKYINDTLGHPIGDQLLKIVARRLVSCMREEDTVARLGGDEFIAVMEGPLQSRDVAIVAQRILEALSQPFDLSNQEIFVTTSIGISLYPQDGKNVTELVKNADTTMYRAKEQGRNIYQFYTTELTNTALKRFMLETGLRHALVRAEFELYYQPIVCFKTDKIVCAEALIRWRHSQEGLILPARFIPLAEETGLIEPIGEWVLHAACTQARAWQAAGLAPIRIAVNLSSRQLMNSRLFDQVQRMLHDTGLEPHCLDLEITESSLMHDPGKARTTLNALQTLGVGLVIDDFGIGYSSMSYLKQFSISMLKVDRSFVADIRGSGSDMAIIRAIIALCHSVGVKVGAEGVETKEQRAVLKAEGCDEMQGYLFSKPLPAEAFTELLRNSHVAHSERAIVASS